MILSFHPIIKAHKNIVVADKEGISNRVKRLIRGADAVILPQVAPFFLIETLLEYQKPHFPDQSLRIGWRNKVDQLNSFHLWGVDYPKTLVFEDLNSLFAHSTLLSQRPGFPFLIKSANEHEGNNILLVEDEKGLEELYGKRQDIFLSSPLLVQEYIESQGYVLRVVTLYKDYVGYWKKGDSLVVNISKGAKIVEDFRPELIREGIESVRRVKTQTRLDLAAVDMVFSLKEPACPYWLEVNFFFGRKGLGGRHGFYKLLLSSVSHWLTDLGLKPEISLWV